MGRRACVLTDCRARSVENELRDARYVVRVVKSKVVDVGMNPARPVSRVEVDGDTSLVDDAVAKTVRQRRIVGDVDAVERVLPHKTRPGAADHCIHRLQLDCSLILIFNCQLLLRALTL